MRTYRIIMTKLGFAPTSSRHHPRATIPPLSSSSSTMPCAPSSTSSTPFIV